MQEVKVHRWCDVCHADNGARVEVTNRYTISLSTEGRTPLVRTLETCDIHAKPLEELRELLKVAGIVPKAPTPTAAEVRETLRQGEEPTQPELPLLKDAPRVRCPLCSHGYARTAIIKHLAAMHGVKPLKQPTRCPDCSAKFSQQHSMSMHRRVAHHHDYLSEMLAQHEARSKK